jgi:hypothetical protein
LHCRIAKIGTHTTPSLGLMAIIGGPVTLRHVQFIEQALTAARQVVLRPRPRALSTGVLDMTLIELMYEAVIRHNHHINPPTPT